MDGLPEQLQERLGTRGFGGRVAVSFGDVARPGTAALYRTHPIVAALAEALVEGALTGDDGLPRAGAWTVRSEEPMRTLALLRIRHRIRRASAGASDFLLAEEIVPLLWRGTDQEPRASGLEALAVLSEERGATLPDPVRRRQVDAARERIAASGSLSPFLAQRAADLAEDHDRLRAAASGRARTVVEPIEPPDLIGLYVIVPEQA